MKITPEDINKLDQLDRIEYRQKVKEIETLEPLWLTKFVLLGSIYGILFYFSLIIASIKMGRVDSTQLLLKCLFPGLVTTHFIIICSYLLDIAVLIIGIGQKKKLNEEYFELEAKD